VNYNLSGFQQLFEANPQLLFRVAQKRVQVMAGAAGKCQKQQQQTVPALVQAVQ
jgi:hypothetical protein